jgi:hypothetical protein
MSLTDTVTAQIAMPIGSNRQRVTMLTSVSETNPTATVGHGSLRTCRPRLVA